VAKDQNPTATDDATEQKPEADRDQELAASERSQDDNVPLEQLSPPKRRLRTVALVVMVLTALLAAGTLWSLRGEVLYSFSSDDPVELGNLAAAKLSNELDNRYVRARAALDRGREIRYRRAGDADKHRLVPLKGAKHLWVEYRVAPEIDGPRYVPPSYLTGRLVKVDRLGLRYHGVQSALTQVVGADASGRAWLLVDGAKPRSMRWVMALVALLLAFLAWNLYGLVRIIRKPADR